MGQGALIFPVLGTRVLLAYNRREDEYAAAQVIKGAAGRWILSSLIAQKETARVIAPSRIGKGHRPYNLRGVGRALRITYLFGKAHEYSKPVLPASCSALFQHCSGLCFRRTNGSYMTQA